MQRATVRDLGAMGMGVRGCATKGNRQGFQLVVVGEALLLMLLLTC